MTKYATIDYGIIKRRFRIEQEIVDALPDEYTDDLVGHSSDRFVNKYGVYTRARGPSKNTPVGVNASFVGKDGTKVEQTYWGFVQLDEAGNTYVPGWCATAKILNHPDKCPRMNLLNPQVPTGFYSKLPPGTDIRPILRAQGYEV